MMAAEVSLPRKQMPATYLIMSQLNPVHTFISYNFESLFLLFSRLTPKSSLPFVRSYYTFICIYNLFETSLVV
jgi:hypothetical protein